MFEDTNGVIIGRVYVSEEMKEVFAVSNNWEKCGLKKAASTGRSIDDRHQSELVW